MESAPSHEVVPRPAATVLALRPAAAGFEVLMVRRAREARFMGGAHVFPGGGVDDIDHGPEAEAVVRWSGHPDEFPWRAAALRELAEEAGIVPGTSLDLEEHATGADLYRHLAAAGVTLDADRLAWVSNWITPRGLPRRFDARFYAIAVPGDTAVRSDQREVYDAVWVRPDDALAAADSGAWQVEMPTRAHLEMLTACRDIGEVLARGVGVPPAIEPRLVIDDTGAWGAVLPGEPGYEEAGA